MIRLKSNQTLGQLAEEFISIVDDHPWHETGVHYHTVNYQAQSWEKVRRVSIRSTREGGELLFRHEFIVINISETVSSTKVFSVYAQRGAMENFIKEAKNGFFFDITDSSRFIESQARIMLNVIVIRFLLA